MQQGGVLGTPVRNEFDAKVRMMCKVTSALPIGEMELIRNIDALTLSAWGYNACCVQMVELAQTRLFLLSETTPPLLKANRMPFTTDKTI